MRLIRTTKMTVKNEKIIKKGNTMKNNRFSKILVFVLSLALLIGSAFAVSVSAEGDDAYTFIGMNIVHGDQTNVVLAVDATLAEKDDVVVTYKIGDNEPAEAKYWEEESSDGFLVYYTKGIAPKDLGLDVKVEVHSRSDADYVADYENAQSANVVWYLYSMLYGENDYINATDESGLNHKAMYASMLTYANYAQEVLWNEKNPEDTRASLFNRVYVYAPEATIGEVLLDEAGTVTLTPAVENVTGWKLTTYNADGTVTETTVAAGDPIEVSAHTVITAIIEEAWAYAPNANALGFDDFDPDKNVSGLTGLYSGNLRFDNVSGGTIKAVEGAFSNSQKLEIDSTTGYPKLFLNLLEDNANSNTVVFEHLVTIGSTATGGVTHHFYKSAHNGSMPSNSNVLAFGLGYLTSGERTEEYLGDLPDASYLCIRMNSVPIAVLGDYVYNANKNSEFHLRVEVAQNADYTAGTVSFYVNGELVATQDYTASNAGRIQCVRYNIGNGQKWYFDDMYLGYQN